MCKLTAVNLLVFPSLLWSSLLTSLNAAEPIDWYSDVGKQRWVVDAITMGKVHECSICGKYAVPASSRATVFSGASRTTDDAIVVWITCRTVDGDVVPLREVSHAELVDENGFAVSPESVRVYAKNGDRTRSRDSISKFGERGELLREIIGETGENAPNGGIDVMCCVFRKIRSGIRRGFVVRVIGQGGRGICEIKTNCEYNPSRSVWVLENRACTSNENLGDIEVHKMSLQSPRSLKVLGGAFAAQSELRWYLGVDLKISRDGHVLQKWRVVDMQVSDEFGNRSRGTDIRISPLETVWKLHLKIEHENGESIECGSESDFASIPNSGCVEIKAANDVKVPDVPRVVAILGMGDYEIRTPGLNVPSFWDELEFGSAKLSWARVRTERTTILRMSAALPAVVCYIPSRIGTASLVVRTGESDSGRELKMPVSGMFRLVEIPGVMRSDLVRFKIYGSQKGGVEQVEILVLPQTGLDLEDRIRLEERVRVVK